MALFEYDLENPLDDYADKYLSCKFSIENVFQRKIDSRHTVRC
jgi:hypothetical protein